MAVTARLCERIAATAYENLGTSAIEAARRLVEPISKLLTGLDRL
jgi:hypothetical protein